MNINFELDIFSTESSNTPAQNVSTNAGEISTQTATATAVFNADFTTKMNEIQQFCENFPAEFVDQPRFFSLLGNTKDALPKGWSKPENQKHLANCKGFVGFDTVGHGNAADYAFLDFDHVLKADGNFVNDSVADTVNLLQLTFPNIYIEKSVSGTGLHAFLVPTDGIFNSMAASSNFTLNFGDSAKLEIFYKTGGRYCLLTGNKYDDGAEIPRGEKVDEFLKSILAEIQKQNPTPEKTEKNLSSVVKQDRFDDPPEYRRALAMFLLTNYIHCVEVKADADWLSVMSSCKTLSVPESFVEQWNKSDLDRYNAKENQDRIQSLSDPNFAIGNLIGKSKKLAKENNQKLNIKKFKKNWYKTHPEFSKKNSSSRADEQDTSTTKENSEILSREEKFALFSLPHTDLCNAKRLVMWHGKSIRYLTDSGKWYVYDDKKKIWLDGGRESAAILPFAHELSHIITLNADDSESDGTDEKLAKKWQTRKTLSNAIELAKGFPSIRITEQDLNTHKSLLNCKNGVVDLQTGKLYPHDSRLLFTQCVNAEYIPNYTDETVEKFFRDVLPDDETREFFFDFLGYCLTGEIREEKALFIHGRGGNGKGTATKMLLTLMSDYACGFPIEAVLMQPRIKDADTATPAFAKLQWCRLALAEEIPAGRKLDYAKFKILTGGDALPIRKLYQDATEIKDPTHKMIFSGNHLPELDDTHDPGILRRWLQVTFGQDFNGTNRDDKLKQKLTTPTALSALLNILVTRAGKWYENGLFVPEKLDRAKELYFAANDFVEEFINEFCDRGDGLSVKRKTFLDKLRSEYPRETNGKSDSQLTSLVCRIKGINYYRPNGIRHFRGIRWKN